MAILAPRGLEFFCFVFLSLVTTRYSADAHRFTCYDLIFSRCSQIQCFCARWWQRVLHSSRCFCFSFRRCQQKWHCSFQIYSGAASNYVLWNDQFYDDPVPDIDPPCVKYCAKPWGHSCPAMVFVLTFYILMWATQVRAAM